MKTLLLILSLTLISSSYARECEGEATMVTFSCLNPLPGADVRLTVIEYQSCSKGKIVGLDRLISAWRFLSTEDRHIQEENIEIQFGPRAHHDPARSVDFLTFAKPTEVIAHDVKSDIVMKISGRLVQLPGLLEKHYPGTFKIIKKEDNRVLYSGKLSCTITR